MSDAANALVKGTATMTPAERKAMVLARAKAKKEGGEAYVPYVGGINFIKCDGNTGDLVYGKDKHPIPKGQRFIANFAEAQHGVIEWKGSQVVNRRLANYLMEGMAPGLKQGEKYVERGAAKRDGWQDVVVIPMVGVGGDLDKLTLSFDAQNQSAIQQAQNLLGEMTNMTETAWGEEGFYNAVVEVSTDSYQNKNYNKTIYFPVFTIVGWSDGFTIREMGDDTAMIPWGDDDFDPND